MRARTISLGWSHPITEDDYRIRLRVVPGSPGRSYGEPGDCYPAEAAEIEVLEVREDRVNGIMRQDLIPLVEEELSGMEDEIDARCDDASAEARAAYYEDR